MSSKPNLVAALCALWLMCSCEVLAGIPERSGSGTSPQQGAAGASAAPSCQQYCKQVEEACTDDYRVYKSSDACKQVCATQLLDEGDVMCRAKEAQRARDTGDEYLHCQGASLGGSQSCGGYCANYCRMMETVCMPSLRDPNEREDCERKCGQLIDREQHVDQAPTGSRYDITRDHEGDTLQCRLVHLTIAAGDPDGHCWHAAIAPRVRVDPVTKKPEGNPCATLVNTTEPRCEDYCQLVMGVCTAEHQVYETVEQCQKVCEKLDKGSVVTEERETVACRKIHAYNAITTEDVNLHCPHAGPGGDVTCGNDCTGYCQLLRAGCKAAFDAKFGASADPMQSCTMNCSARHGHDPVHYSVSSAKAKGSNPIACGLLFAARALEKPTEAASLCPSAIGESECAR